MRHRQPPDPEPRAPNNKEERGLDAVHAAVEAAGPSNVCRVITSPSCFAPRSADACSDVAKMCDALDVGHVINNAYGIQAAQLCKEVTHAAGQNCCGAAAQVFHQWRHCTISGAIAPSLPPLHQQWHRRACADIRGCT